MDVYTIIGHPLRAVFGPARRPPNRSPKQAPKMQSKVVVCDHFLVFRLRFGKFIKVKNNSPSGGLVRPRPPLGPSRGTCFWGFARRSKMQVFLFFLFADLWCWGFCLKVLCFSCKFVCWLICVPVFLFLQVFLRPFLLGRLEDLLSRRNGTRGLCTCNASYSPGMQRA